MLSVSDCLSGFKIPSLDGDTPCLPFTEITADRRNVPGLRWHVLLLMFRGVEGIVFSRAARVDQADRWPVQQADRQSGR